MRNFIIPLAVLAAMTAALSCSEEVGVNESALAETLETKAADKIINLVQDACPGSILFKIDESADESFFAELSSKGIVNIKKVFNSVPGKEELEAQFGLDKWYEAELAEGTELRKIANTLAQFDAVSLVEYNSLMTKASDCIAYGLDESMEPQTKASSAFNDPYLSYQWHYANTGSANVANSAVKGADINVKDVWASLTCGDPDIVIAVVDEGVKYTHPDLKANMWSNTKEIAGNGIDDDGNGYVDDIYGYNFVAHGPITWGLDGDSGHGTHCAGTIAAVNNNNLGVSGVAGGSGNNDGCRIMSCQIFDGNSGGKVSQIAEAVKYAADNGASIISCSFGNVAGAFTTDNQYEKRSGAELAAINYFKATKNNNVVDGGIAIFAAGNDGKPFATYPGAYHDIISVSAFGPDYLPTKYTNYGPGCNIVAPGGDAGLKPWTSYAALVLSTLPSESEVNTFDGKRGKGNDYGYMQGTSMACPHASGIMALGLSYAKKLGKSYTRIKFQEMFLTSANDFESQLNKSGASKDYANTNNNFDLAPYRKQMGTGSIDAWLFMMQIEGIPSLIAKTGSEQWIDISSYFGTASVNLTYLSVEVSDKDRESLGLAADPYMKYGKLFIHPTKVGSGKIKVTAVGGGTALGGGDNPTGGMEVSQEISIVSRSFKSENGGWL